MHVETFLTVCLLTEAEGRNNFQGHPTFLLQFSMTLKSDSAGCVGTLMVSWKKNTESPCDVDIQFPCCLSCFPLLHLSDPTRGQCGSVARIILVFAALAIYIPAGLQLNLTACGVHVDKCVLASEPTECSCGLWKWWREWLVSPTSAINPDLHHAYLEKTHAWHELQNRSLEYNRSTLVNTEPLCTIEGKIFVILFTNNHLRLYLCTKQMSRGDTAPCSTYSAIIITSSLQASKHTSNVNNSPETWSYSRLIQMFK